MIDINNYEAVFLRIHETVKADEFGQRSPWIAMGIWGKDARIASSALNDAFRQTEPHQWRGKMDYAYLGWNENRAAQRGDNTKPDHIFEIIKFPMPMVATLRDDQLKLMVEEISRETLRGQVWLQEDDRTTATFFILPTKPSDVGDQMQRTFYRKGLNFLERLSVVTAEIDPADPRLMSNRFAAEYAPRQLVAPKASGASTTQPVIYRGPTLAMRKTNRGTGIHPDPKLVRTLHQRMRANREREEAERLLVTPAPAAS